MVARRKPRRRVSRFPQGETLSHRLAAATAPFSRGLGQGGPGVPPYGDPHLLLSVGADLCVGPGGAPGSSRPTAKGVCCTHPGAG